MGPDGLLSTEQQHALRSTLERRAPYKALAATLHAAARMRGSARRHGPTPTDREQLLLHWDWLNQQHMDEHLAEVDPQVLGPELS